MFLEPTEDAALQNHSIRTIVPSVSEHFCRVQCYLENECVSYNYGRETCQLNNSTAAEHPLHLKPKPNFIYRGIQVNKEFLSHSMTSPSSDGLNVRPPFWKNKGHEQYFSPSAALVHFHYSTCWRELLSPLEISYPLVYCLWFALLIFKEFLQFDALPESWYMPVWFWSS